MKRLREGGFLIAKIHYLAGRIFARILKRHNLEEINTAQGRILFVLWKQDGIPINELAKKTQLGKSTLTSMLDRLEEAGHLRRVHSKKDRREILIKLTEKDRQMQKIYEKVSQEMTDLFYEDFKGDEINRFENDLKRVLENLLKHETNQGNPE